MTSGPEPTYGQSTAWQPERPRFRLFPLFVSWFATGLALMVAAAILPGVDIEGFWGALLVAAIVGALNAVIPPVLAALRLPLTLVLGFLVVLIADALILLIAADVTDGVLTVDSFGWALLAAFVVAAVSVVLAVILGSDDTSAIRIAQRIARRQGIIASTDVPGIIYLEIDGLALPVLRRAMRDGNAPTMARRLADDTHRLTEWETDLSSQTGASQAGILLGSNVVTVSDDEVARMFSACEDWQELLTIAVLAYLGPRRRAAAQVRQRDVDLKRGTMGFQEKGGKVVVKPMPDELVAILRVRISSSRSRTCSATPGSRRLSSTSEGARSSSRWSVYATSHGGASAASCYSRMQ